MFISTVRTAAASIVLALAVGGSASAAVVAFNGTRENVTPLVGAPGGRCGAAITVTLAPGALSSTGTSNFGNFSLSESHCIPGPPPNPYDQGLFEWTFDDGSTLYGTYTGAVTAPPAPGPFLLASTALIGGGTGRFLGATGTLNSTGTLRLGTVDGRRVSIGAGVITADIDAPAIPEPGTWALMIMGFGAAGVMLRSRRHTPGAVSRAVEVAAS